MMKQITVALILMIAFAAVAFAQSSGKDLFAAKCVVCHSADGSGNTVMGKKLQSQDLRTPEVQKQSDADLKATITKGKNKKMPAYGEKLTGEQIDQLVAYIRELGKQK